MKKANVYLTFDGNCKQAVSFYQQCLGGQLDVMTFGEAKGVPGIKPESKDRIMHAVLTTGPAVIMASDSMPGMPFQQGNNVSISIDCETEEEIDRLFQKFSKNGKITMPLDHAFWGAKFGMIIDQFGVHWMFNFDKPGAK